MTAMSRKENLQDKVFDQKWEIKNWKAVVENDTITENTKIEINLEEGNVVYAKVLVGTSCTESGIGFYWKFLHKHHCLDDAQVNLLMEIFRRDDKVNNQFNVQANLATNVVMQIGNDWWLRCWIEHYYDFFTNLEGSLKINLKFTLKNLPDINCASQPEKFNLSSKNELTRSLETLLDDSGSSDVKIVTKDKVELLAHKLILSSRSPVFASMFGSDFLESSDGFVNVDDISAKTMKILLKYWYTGELSQTWKDDDTIVEFTYAAGKYQMTSVLEMLDDLLGIEIDFFEGDVELLKIVQLLSLKNAEYRILKRIIQRISQAESGTKILNMFYPSSSSPSNDIDEQSFKIVEFLRTWNDTLSENDKMGATYHDMKLMTLACKHGLKNVENKLLEHIKDTLVSKVANADDLFAIFYQEIKGNDGVTTCDGSESKDLLVRANP